MFDEDPATFSQPRTVGEMHKRGLVVTDLYLIILGHRNLRVS